MVTFRNNSNSNRRGGFRRNNRNFKSNTDNSKFSSNFSNNDNFKRKVPGRNNHNAPKLVEKYNDLAREALSNGDKILSENYLQHADHFTRVLNEKELIKKEKFMEVKSEDNSVIQDVNLNSSDQHRNKDKDMVENSNDDSKINKSSKPQVEVI